MNELHTSIAKLQEEIKGHSLSSFSVPPSIRMSPPNGQLKARKGGSITLECKASGNPVPSIHWTRKVSSIQHTMGFMQPRGLLSDITALMKPIPQGTPLFTVSIPCIIIQLLHFKPTDEHNFITVTITL